MTGIGEAFLGEGNVAGKNMLKLCARGSAIISELLRLSENIPSAFLMHEKDARYAQVLLDYQFFKNEAHYDSRISADQGLIELDDEVKENNLGLIVRFYNMFESIHKYVMDLLRYLGDVEEGVYVSHTLDRILLDVDGKQLMSEALYLYGMMLWLLDLRIDGQVRARGVFLTIHCGLTSRAGP
jgi:WASH complex subunit strumpellin